MEQEKTTNQLREEYCAGLEALAEFLRFHDSMPLPPAVFTHHEYSKPQFVQLVSELGTCSKEYRDWFMSVVKTFGPVQYRLSIPRETVCKRKVVGKKLIPARASCYLPETAAYEEDIIEWECKPLLEPEEVK